MIALIQKLAVDVIGLGFGGAAIFLVITGHVNEPGFGVAASLAGAYLGLRTAS